MTITVLSLGWGVQSFTLAAMAALGDLPRPTLTIHSDTTWERSATYEFAEKWSPWLASHDINVVTVQGKRAHIPLHQSKSSKMRYVLLPAFYEKSGKPQKNRRRCTHNWKVEPQERHVRRWLKENGYPPTTHTVKLLGISLDEWQRAKDSGNPKVTCSYPLLDRRMTRLDCIKYLLAHGLDVPPKSSCVMCPFHNARAWQEMKREAGKDWQRAVEYDVSIKERQTAEGKREPGHLHRSLRPLAEAVQLPEELPYAQHDFLDEDGMTCDSGHCFFVDE